MGEHLHALLGGPAPPSRTSCNAKRATEDLSVFCHRGVYSSALWAYPLALTVTCS